MQVVSCVGLICSFLDVTLASVSSCGFYCFKFKKRSFSMKAKSALSLALAAGFAGTAMASSPTTLSPTNGQVTTAAHIYFNIATGERVITVLANGDTAPAAADSHAIWSSIVPNQCADEGFTTSYFFGVDNNTGTSSLATDITNLDFGDIALDTVVDMVHIDWVTAHEDVDTDLDGIGDGVGGLGGTWTYWDADNGRAINASTRLALIEFTLINLPGNVFGPGQLTGYTADIDLAASFSSSLTFELGDSDGDAQGAAFSHTAVEDQNNLGTFGPIATLDNDFDGNPDSDLDGDGLFDWAWSVRFAQPGTRDLDGDGVIDGDFADSMQTIGVSFGAGAGTAVDNGDGTWTWDLNTTDVDAANGQEDAFAIYAPPVGGEILHAGFFWFGGLACIDDNGYTPGAAFEHQLFGPSDNPCPADINNDESLNFFDISAFLAAFSAQEPVADFDGNGSWNFFDISAFLTAFSAGCPG
jgi:hypothetical protein